MGEGGSPQQDPLLYFHCQGHAQLQNVQGFRQARVNILFSGDIRPDLEGFDPGRALAQHCGWMQGHSLRAQAKASDVVLSRVHDQPVNATALAAKAGFTQWQL